MVSDAHPRKRQRKDSPEDEDLDAHDATERACDACRTRRVKCDKTTPCANCRRRGDECHTTAAPTFVPRARTSITKEHEKRFDSMADQLATIETLLRQQQDMIASVTQMPANTGFDKKSEISTTSITALHTPESQPSHDTSDATTETHSTVARELVERAVENNPAVYQDSELIDALRSLKDMAGKTEDGPNSLDYSEAMWRPLYQGSGRVDPPSPDEMRRIIQEADGSISLGFTPGLTVAVLREKVDSVFKHGVAPNSIDAIYVYGTLRNLVVEFGGQHRDAAFARRCKDLSAHFSMELGRAVNNLKLIIPATTEAAAALTVASGAAMELCRPLIAQSLSSKAASIVLSLGYNRLSSMRNDSESARQVKIFIFWMVYWLDTSFSVRLGRAPIIRPHDVAVPQLSEDSIIPKGWAVAFNYSTRISGLQCKVVEQLYTPLAVQQSLEERKNIASRLLDELNQTWEMRGSGPHSIALWRDSEEVMHYSTICLVQHATMSASNIESPALESARRALTLNVEAWERHKHLPDFIWAGHCHWTLLKGPITPFVVTFCHIIAHPFTVQEDLRLLADFVQTMDKMRRFSDGMIRLHKLCDIFAKVATLYVQAKSREATFEASSHNNNASSGATTGLDPSSEDFGQYAVGDIDEYLASMGFAPPAPHNGGVSEGIGDLPDFDPNFLMDWYQGNNSLMGFLEQDLSITGDSGFDFPPG